MGENGFVFASHTHHTRKTGFYERTYGKILEVDLKEEEEYNKVILGRVVEGCSNEKGYKKYSKEKDQRVRDLLEVRLNRTERLLDLDTGIFF